MILELTKKTFLSFLIVILALFVYQYHSQAFPEFSPNFALKKSAVIEKANSYARSLGLDPEPYYQALTFNEATEDKFFLEREYGLERLKAEVKAGVSIWYWRVRNFIPGEKEEFSLKLDTEGNLVGFNHQVEETTVRLKLTKEEALAKAEQFLATYIKQHPQEKLELTENGENEKPGYYSYSFTWKRTDWHWGTGTYHLHLRVDGDQVGRYSEHLKEPEEWRRDFAKQRSENRIYGFIAWSAAALLAVGVFIMFIRIIVKDRRFWHNFPLKWTMPVSLLLLISSFSRFPDLLSQYSTQHNFYVFITNAIIGTTFATLTTLMGFLIVAFMADVFWQKSFPEHVSVRSLLSGRGLATKEAIRSIPLGFGLALAALAYVTAYYLIGSRFNIWVPSSIDYSQVVTSYFPALEALTVGIRAAWMEEFFFRILALVLIFRLTGSKWLAIIVSATVWGFMHSNYPQMPGYARGIELTLEGIVFGWVAVRFGILTTFISHCLFNTWLGAIFAWRIGSPSHMVMAVAVSIWPLALWGVGKIKTGRLGRFLSPAELLAKATLVPQIRETEAIIAAKHRRPRRSVVVGSTLAAAAMFLALAMVPEPPLADLGSITLTPEAAKNFSDVVFQQQTGLDPDLYRRSVRHYTDMSGADTEYLLEHTDAETLAGHIRSSLYHEYWYVYYFRAEERNTYTAILDPEGGLLIFSRSISEDDPGAELEQAEAVALAADYLQERLALLPDQFKMVRYNMTEKTSRRDHSIIFESTAWDIGESKLRWSISILGDSINSFGSHVTVPEEYSRKKSAMGWKDAINSLIGRTNTLLMGIGLIALFITLLKGRYINWRHSLRLGLFGLLFAVIAQTNQISDFYTGYSTTQTMLNFIATKGLGIMMVLIMAYLSFAFSFAILGGLVRWLTGVNAVSALLGNDLHDARQRFSQGVGVGILAWAVLGGVEQLSYVLHATIFNTGLFNWNTFTPTGFSTGVSYLATALGGSLLTSLASGTVVLILIFIRKKHRGFLFLGLFFLVLMNLKVGWQSSLESAYVICYQILITLLELWLLLRLIRFNGYGYLFFFYYQALLPSVLIMSLKGWPAYWPDISLLWIAAITPVVMAAFFTLSHLMVKVTPVAQGDI
jgi:hypothetical protein